MRKNAVIPGTRAWVVDCAGYDLPAGLVDRQPVQVILCTGYRAVVSDDTGNKWDLNPVNVDTGHTYWFDGFPYDESHPLTLHHLHDALARLVAELAMNRAPYTGWYFEMQERIEELRWRLERNGYNPDSSLPRLPAPRLQSPPDTTTTCSIRGNPQGLHYRPSSRRSI